MADHQPYPYAVPYVPNPVFVPFPKPRDTESLNDGESLRFIESSRYAESLQYAESLHTRNDPPHWFLIRNPSGVTPAVFHHKYPGQGTPESPYAVDFLPDDASNPLNYAPGKKWKITGLQALAAFAVTMASTTYSGGIFEVKFYFGVSDIMAILGLSLYLFGFAIGPFLWAPLSEIYGRQIVFFITYLGLAVFCAGAAGAPNIETLLIMRFLAGAFGVSPLTNAGGVVVDLFDANDRGPASGLMALAPFLGPAIGPIIGGFLGESAGWRWINGLMAIFTGVLWIANSLYVPETYAPVLLQRRAAKLSQMTGRVYASKLDLANKTTRAEQIKTTLSRPWALLFVEPIVALLSVYLAIVYGTLYMLFAAFPIVFQINRGWSAGVGGLAFLGVMVGMLIGVGYAMADNKRYMRIAAANNGVAPPEARLRPALLGSVLLPVGLFWFAWTNGPEIHWIVPVLASAFFSAGLITVFLSLLSYMIDSYSVFAASVLAANSVLRSLFGAAFPLFTPNMYKNLGIHWAASIPAFLALACMPFPFYFLKYGARIRAKCKYAAEAAAISEQMRAVHGEAVPGVVATGVVREEDAREDLEDDVRGKDVARTEARALLFDSNRDRDYAHDRSHEEPAAEMDEYTWDKDRYH